MSENLPLPLTETLGSPPPQGTKKSSAFKGGPGSGGQPKSEIKSRNWIGLGHWMVGVWAVIAACATGTQTNFSQLLERQAQTLFFEMRGAVAVPNNIVILAMDEDTQVQGNQIYSQDPQKYAYLEPLQSSPPKRAAYAIAIDRLMQAGARAVALDIVLDASSSYGPEDDRQLQAVLEKYAGRVTLAALYSDNDSQTNRTGDQTQLLLPNPIFQTSAPSIGFINYPIDADGRFHYLASQYPKLVAQTYPPELAQQFLQLNGKTPSFAEAALQAAKLPYPQPKGQNIFFYGPQGTFQQIPFWHVFDPTNREVHLKEGTFKDKIVLIGPTAKTYQDFHAAPFSKSFLYPDAMAGIEIHANSIATLLEDKSIGEAIPSIPLQAGVVLVIVIGAGYLQSRTKRALLRLAVAISVALAWGGIAYALFIQGRQIIPTAMPIMAIVLSGASYLATGLASEYRSKQKMRQTFKEYASVPIVQEMLSQLSRQDAELQELHDLLQQRQMELSGKKLAFRYEITKVLGSGGFGETYIARDIQRPGAPACVVKQLRPTSNNPRLFQLSRRMFQREAEALEKLGKHDQIPQLLAYFEEDQEFYLVQEFIEGAPLTSELAPGAHLPETKVVSILQELLQILEFVHSQGVIHRDIKPSNIIRRKSDSRLVLIDFGAVKEISQLSEEDGRTNMTIGIGTQGYMPNEQSGGKPRLSSDIYAIGMTGIQALTGYLPSKFKEDPNTGEILWKHYAKVSYPLADVLSKMVRYDYKKRYQSATEALTDLSNLPIASLSTPSEIDPLLLPAMPSIDSEPATAEATRPWPQTFGTSSLPATESSEDE